MPPAVVRAPAEVAMVEAALATHGKPIEGTGSLFVYFMQAGDHGPIKIGHARDVFKRRMMLQTGNPFPLRITRVLIGSYTDEGWLHSMFADLRLCGEWFRAHPALANIADAKPDPAVPEDAFVLTSPQKVFKSEASYWFWRSVLGRDPR